MSDVIRAWDAIRALPRPKLTELFAGDAGRVGLLAQRIDLPDGGILFGDAEPHH